MRGWVLKGEGGGVGFGAGKERIKRRREKLGEE